MASVVSRTALVLCCTPFQAVLVKEVLRHEQVDNYNLIYLALNNSDEDKFYYRVLARKAKRSQYICARETRYDILRHILVCNEIDKDMARGVDLIALSSFDSLAFRQTVCQSPGADIITFDDGSGYINQRSDLSVPRHPLREGIYGWLLGARTRDNFKKRVSRHYSIYPGLTNIMPSAIIRYINLFPDTLDNKISREESGVGTTVFIGQPLRDDVAAAYVDGLKTYLSSLKLDYYMRHPRESEPLIRDVPLLEKDGRIAEEVIFELAKRQRLTIISGFSSVLLNVSANIAEKVMILDRKNDKDVSLANLGASTGCKILFI